MFGQEAAKQLDYVECFPNGYKKGTKIAKACADAKIEGFPTWVINGQVRNVAFICLRYLNFILKISSKLHWGYCFGIVVKSNE